MVRYRSINKKILLPYLHLVLLKKLPVLVWERLLFVVLLLLSDIVDYHLLVSYRVGKSSKLFRPAVKTGEMRILLQPGTGHRFYRLDKPSYGQQGGQFDKKMHMFRHPAYSQQFDISILAHTMNERVQLPLVFLVDSAFSAICADDNVVVKLCVTHSFAFFVAGDNAVIVGLLCCKVADAINLALPCEVALKGAAFGSQLIVTPRCSIHQEDSTTTPLPEAAPSW